MTILLQLTYLAYLSDILLILKKVNSLRIFEGEQPEAGHPYPHHLHQIIEEEERSNRNSVDKVNNYLQILELSRPFCFYSWRPFCFHSWRPFCFTAGAHFSDFCCSKIPCLNFLSNFLTLILFIQLNLSFIHNLSTCIFSD